MLSLGTNLYQANAWDSQGVRISKLMECTFYLTMEPQVAEKPLFQMLYKHACSAQRNRLFSSEHCW